MHHYTKRTASSLMDDKEMKRHWEGVIPEEALKHPFLMEGLLAMSALHLTSMRPKERITWTPLAFKHQHIALSHFRSIIPDINEENCHALLALSILISVTSMAFTSFGTNLGPDESIPVRDIIEPFMLIRGYGEIVGAAVQWLFIDPLRSVLVGHGVNVCEALPPIPVAERFSQLCQMVTNLCQDGKFREVLTEAIETLQYVYTELIFSAGTELNKNPGIAWKWPYMCSQEYSNLLRKSHGGALIIFAHFALLSKTWDGIWFLHGWAPRVINGIYAAVEPCWKEWLEWPRQQIRDNYPILRLPEKPHEEVVVEIDSQECSPEFEQTPLAVDIIDERGKFVLKFPWREEMMPMSQALQRFYAEL
ncbi:hypothetical protein FKW77_004430 [Venturia effusa]|uniref:Uncharacterized protein n=1 Tax=Venturia effusa TaxID=50376 RepID=A0A517LQ25_9PEZI|nr:hypothetical protein FKW77_004430 [Venturia effusa]